MRLSKAVVKNRVLILIVALLLLIPSVLGMANTRINYDMLDYLPEDMDTVVGQNELLDEFGKGAFSLIVVEDMPAKDVAALRKRIEAVEHVDSAVWYDSLTDLSVPMEILPEKIYNEFNNGNATMLAVFFDSSTSADVTMDAIREIRAIAGRQCFVTGMSALVTDLKDLCERGGADLCGAGCGLRVPGHDAAAGQLAGAADLPGQYRHLHCDQPGQQLLPGRDFLHHQGAVRRAAAGRDDGLFHLPVE